MRRARRIPLLIIALLLVASAIAEPPPAPAPPIPLYESASDLTSAIQNPQSPSALPFSDLHARILADRNTLVIDNATVRIFDQLARLTAKIPLNQPPTLANTTLVLELPDTDLALLAPHTSNILAPQGRLSLTLDLAPDKQPTGRLQIRDAALRPIPGLPRITAIDIDATLHGQRLDITRATALAGTQPVAINGYIDLPENLLALQSTLDLRPNISLRAANIPLVRNPGFILRADLDLRVETPPAAATPRVTGAITLRDSLFLSDLRDLWAARPASGPESRPPFFAVAAPPFNDWPLNIAVRGDRFMRVRSTAFNARLSAAFRVEGTLGEPRATGDATIDTGSVIFPFATFAAQTGRVRLTQANPYMPQIEFTATARALGYDLALSVNGPASAPMVAFTSNPALTSDQILLFIMAGEAPNNEYAAPAQQRALSLGAYFGQTLLSELFGFTPGEDRLTLTSGEKLTRLGRETYAVEYKFTDRLSAVGEYDEFDAYNLGLKARVYASKPPQLPAPIPPPPPTTPSAQPAPSDQPTQSVTTATENAATITAPASALQPFSPSALSISGQGWWTNLQNRRLLQRALSLDARHAPALNANEIEDAALILLSQLTATGYLHPQLEITLTPADAALMKNEKCRMKNDQTPVSAAAPATTLESAATPKSTDGAVAPHSTFSILHSTLGGGSAATFTATTDTDLILPRDTAATRARIRVRPGTRYKLADITITGLQTLTPAEARAFFIPPTGLLERTAPPYTPDAFRRSTTALLDTLRKTGRSEAAATVTALDIDDATGRVTASLAITEGPLWKITTLTTELPDNTNTSNNSVYESASGSTLGTLNSELLRAFGAKPWSQWTQQDIAERVRQYYFRLGRPDVRVQVTATPETADSALQPFSPSAFSPTAVAVHIQITPGPQVRLGAITYTGNHHTRDTLIRRRITQNPGDLLDPVSLENTRHSLNALGAFHSIDLTVTPPDAPVRDANFALTENPLTDISLLAGYGSYEQLRGGIEASRLNLLGIGDRTRLLLVQSMKSTRGDLSLGVPDLLSGGIDTTVRAFGLRRDEVAFERKEYGGSLTLRRAWGRTGYEALAGYTYEYLNSSNDTLSPAAGDRNSTTAATLNLTLTRDKRDNPLYPKRGYNWYLQAEIASPYLGGQAGYQRYRAGVAYHTAWGGSRWLHFGLSEGLILPLGGMKAENLPINKLFYPGGDNSIRGYRAGDAAPRDINGAFLGAKSYTLFSAELEQSLVKNITATLFYDLLGATANSGLTAEATPIDYPASGRTQWLNTLGLGLRYHTLLGPIRLEYGRNLNPRPKDPKGTLLLSVGVPF